MTAGQGNTRTLSLSHSLTLAPSLSHSHPITLSLSHTLAPSLSHSLTPSLSHSLTLSHTRSITLSLSLPLSLSPQVGRFLLSGDTSLLVLLPTDLSLDSLLALESRLSSKLLADVVQQLNQATSHSTVVSLPKLRLDVQTDLAYILEKLGLSELFSSQSLWADPRGRVFVSDALHRAVLDLGESGVEAAGVTSVSLARSVFVFDALQPFMLVLWDDSLGPLFMGRHRPSQPN
ncbi:plasma protease C1 inhibitor-like [Acipenser oxyrinchus oxyrinchus]|uniref:Plasma protease C1 inhibitor-like n=1 Tax=Acipenser oxyrinchus oxyrinchus TaxID=40147 RepID=A0AAD8FPE4_ACIOX|nr:plasma protease C1 inhibitor-like [Acipenser oxyrinchus oxyrinchus]